MRNIKRIIITGVICFFISALYFSVYTTLGSKIVADRLISEYAGHKELSYKNLEGNLGSGMTFQDLELKNIKDLPAGTIIKIQRLFFNLTSLYPNGIAVEVENIRVMLPNSDPIVISGTFKEQQLNLNIYSKGVTVSEILSYLPDLKNFAPIQGDINDIDLYVTGNYLEPVVKGRLTVEKSIYQGFLLTNAPLIVDLQLKDIKGDTQLYGSVNSEGGELQTQRVLVKLDKGFLTFSGPWDQPRINFKGNSKIEKTRISIVLKGTIENPELTLTSEPSYPQQKLMIMLATGKSWQSVEDSIDYGLNSVALTKDFIDYFFFAGKSNQFAKQFGISDFSVKFDRDHKGISAKKEISENLEVGYGIEQTKTNGLTSDISQKLEGEYKVSDQMSVGVEREMKKDQSSGLLDDQVNQNNDKVILKYKKSF